MRICILFILMAMLGSTQAQVVYPFNPDSNNDSLIGSSDLIDVLSSFGSMFETEAITLDEQPLEELLFTLIAEINELQGQVAALEAESLSLDSVLDLTWGKDFSGLELQGFDFQEASLTYADFTQTNLSGSNLFEADCFRAEFNLCNLTGASLATANMFDSQMLGANLSNADCELVYFGYADLTGATLEGADFTNCYLLNATMSCLIGCPSNLPSPYQCIPDETCTEPGRFKIEAQ
jgi:hypothetical protein